MISYWKESLACSRKKRGGVVNSTVTFDWAAFAQLQLLCQLFPFRSQSNLTSVTYALVAPCSDYCMIAYMGLPLKTILSPQLVQNAATKLQIYYV